MVLELAGKLLLLLPWSGDMALERFPMLLLLLP
jgi:hypothetical protein